MRRWPPARLRGAQIVIALLLASAVAVALALAGHGRDVRAGRGANARVTADALTLDLARTRPLGRGRRFALAPRGRRVAMAMAVAGLRCGARGLAPYGAHVELFAADRVLPVPAGIGWALPVSVSAARVSGGRCAYPLHTDDPSGLVVIDARQGPPPTLGELFSLWNQRLDAHHLAGFSTPTAVHAFLNGRRWSADPRAIPLARHAQVELEIGPIVDPHPDYAFPAGR